MRLLDKQSAPAQDNTPYAKISTSAAFLILCLFFLEFACHVKYVSAEPNSTMPKFDSSRPPIIVGIGNLAIQMSHGNKFNIVNINLEASSKRYFGATMPADHFELKQVKPNIYHFRYKDWSDFFWKINMEDDHVYRVTGGSFGISGGNEVQLNHINVHDSPANPPPLKEQEYVRGIGLSLSGCFMIFDPGRDTLKITFEGNELSGRDDWEVQMVNSSVYHLKFKPMTAFPIFWKLDLKERKMAGIKDGIFGSVGGDESPLPWAVYTLMIPPAVSNNIIAAESEMKQIENNNPKSDLFEDANNKKIAEDIRMKQANDNSPKSDWFENERKIHRNLLMHDTYDILVVPFQVQGYAIDRIGRSLMTRYLAHRIETASNTKVPSPTLVTKAMGELSRRFNDEEVFQLANDLKVKTLIRAYVGHNRDEKMNITLIVQSRDDHDMFSSVTKSNVLEWKRIPFTDERPPSEAFLSLLDDIMTKIQLKQIKKRQVNAYKKETQLTLPKTPLDMLGKPLTPVVNAYYQQLLGALYPEQSAEKEYLFERSLVTLAEVSPKSPDYALIKARAYYYLNRRPAALAAMGSPASVEEKAFAALLNGDMITLEKLVNEITNPIPKLLAQLELNDLRWTYDNKQEAKKSYGGVTRDIPNWEMFVSRRLKNKDVWEVQSNLQIKQALDDSFPIPDFTAQSIVRGKMALGETIFESEDMDLSVYDHYRRLLESQGDQFSENESVHIVKRDVLYLMAAIGESNIFNKMRMRILIQNSLQDGLELLDRYETIDRGHPEVAYLRASVLKALSSTKQGPVRDSLYKSAMNSAYNACYWFQGQTISATQICYAYNFYDGDFPRRWFWNWDFNSYQPGDRSIEHYKFTYSLDNALKKLSVTEKDQLKNLDLALRYTSSDFQPFEQYYRELVRVGLEMEADA